MKHFSYIETAKRIATANWGMKFESDDQADRDMLKNMDVSGACLLALVNQLDVFLEALIEAHLKKRIVARSVKAEECLLEFISTKEAKHGPCPDSVLRDLKNQMYQDVGADLYFYKRLPNGWWYPQAPEQGTPARRDYNKWIRRKAKKTTNEPKP